MKPPSSTPTVSAAGDGAVASSFSSSSSRSHCADVVAEDDRGRAVARRGGARRLMSRSMASGGRSGKTISALRAPATDASSRCRIAMRPKRPSCCCASSGVSKQLIAIRRHPRRGGARDRCGAAASSQVRRSSGSRCERDGTTINVSGGKRSARVPRARALVVLAATAVHRENDRARGIARGALRGEVEVAQRGDLVAPELEAHGIRHPEAVDVDDAAAHAELRDVLDQGARARSPLPRDARRACRAAGWRRA